MSFDYFELVALGIVVLALIYQIFIKKRLKQEGILTEEQLELIDYACSRGVEYAEQLYLNGKNIDRKKVAMDFAFDIIEKAGIIPEEYLPIIEGIIESEVFNLPPTHAHVEGEVNAPEGTI